MAAPGVIQQQDAQSTCFVDVSSLIVRQQSQMRSQVCIGQKPICLCQTTQFNVWAKGEARLHPTVNRQCKRLQQTGTGKLAKSHQFRRHEFIPWMDEILRQLGLVVYPSLFFRASSIRLVPSVAFVMQKWVCVVFLRVPLCVNPLPNAQEHPQKIRKT